MDAIGQLEEREAWQVNGKSDTPDRDAAEWRALEYLQALIDWYDGREPPPPPVVVRYTRKPIEDTRTHGHADTPREEKDHE